MTILRGCATWRVTAAVLTIALVGSLGGCPGSNNPPGGGDGTATLEGTWTGNLDYVAPLSFGGSQGGQPYQQAFTVTFDANGQPDHVELLVDVRKVVLLSTANLTGPGSTDTQSFVDGSTTRNVTLTVQNVSRTQNSYSVTADITIEIANLGSLTGTYTRTATIQGDGTLSWTGGTNLKIAFGDTALDWNSIVSGTLTKQ